MKAGLEPRRAITVSLGTTVKVVLAALAKSVTLIQPMDSNKLRLYSPHPPAECARRLAAAIDSDGVWGLLTGSKPVVGWVIAGSVRLRKRICYRNSFQIVLSARMHDKDGGTLIEGTCGLTALVRAFMMFWFGGVFFFGGILALAAIASLFGLTVSQGSPLAGILIPLAMAAGGLLIVRSGRWLARDEEAFLRQFLAETIDAREAETEGERWAMRR